MGILFPRKTGFPIVEAFVKRDLELLHFDRFHVELRERIPCKNSSSERVRDCKKFFLSWNHFTLSKSQILEWLLYSISFPLFLAAVHTFRCHGLVSHFSSTVQQCPPKATPSSPRERKRIT